MTFHLVADAYFEAENIDDAFIKLSLHFRQLADGKDDTEPELIDSGEIHITKESDVDTSAS